MESTTTTDAPALSLEEEIKLKNKEKTRKAREAYLRKRQAQKIPIPLPPVETPVEEPMEESVDEEPPLKKPRRQPKAAPERNYWWMNLPRPTRFIPEPIHETTPEPVPTKNPAPISTENTPAPNLTIQVTAAPPQPTEQASSGVSSILVQLLKVAIPLIPLVAISLARGDKKNEDHVYDMPQRKGVRIDPDQDSTWSRGGNL